MPNIKLDRYVSERQLQEAFEAYVEETGYGHDKDLEISRVTVEDILDTIDQYATTDVVRLRRGRWIGRKPNGTEAVIDCKDWECSVCHSEYHFEDGIDLKDIVRLLPHCPQCVSEMFSGNTEKATDG